MYSTTRSASISCSNTPLTVNSIDFYRNYTVLPIVSQPVWVRLPTRAPTRSFSSSTFIKSVMPWNTVTVKALSIAIWNRKTVTRSLIRRKERTRTLRFSFQSSAWLLWQSETCGFRLVNENSSCRYDVTLLSNRERSGGNIDFSRSRNTTACGTLDYLAPEIVGHKQYQYQVDNWCVGVLAYELLAGRAPFEGSDDETKSNIANIKYTFPDYFSQLARRFIENVRSLPLVSPKWKTDVLL